MVSLFSSVDDSPEIINSYFRLNIIGLVALTGEEVINQQ